MSDARETWITMNSDVLAGKPVVRGLRISVEHILSALAGGVPEDELLAEYPDLELDDLRACLAIAAGQGHDGGNYGEDGHVRVTAR